MTSTRTSTTERVETAVRCAAERHTLWPAGACLVVGVSGGPDSLCLLGTLLALRARGWSVAPATLIVAHLDHGLRGGQGQQDAAWVRAFAAQLGLRCVTGATDVRRIARAERRSLEDAARTARYRFLREVACEAGAARICVGHTRDDQAETIIMHWLRGSGLAGLAGMAPLEGDIVRPLLAVSHGETVAYCAAQGWQPRVDPTNTDTAFLRNRIRHELLPSLEAYNPALRRILTANAALLAEDEHYLEASTDAAWAACLLEDTATCVTFALPALQAQPLALRHRLLRRVVARLTGHKYSLAAAHIAALDGLLAGGVTGARLDLPGQVRIGIAYGRVECVRASAHGQLAPATPAAPATVTTPHDALSAALPLAVPGAVELPVVGWRVRAWRIERPAGLEAGDPTPPAALPPLVGAGTRADIGRAELRVYLDADAAGEMLTVRTWRPGDRFQPLGMRQTKKLQDYFADAKVPRELRHRLPLVVGRSHILWIGGQRIDERVRLTLATRHILVLQLEPLAQSSQVSSTSPDPGPAEMAPSASGEC
jgi:tRNA(Ile)-lysidine synthase